MEGIQQIITSALQSIAHVQFLAIAAAAGVIMRRPEQIVYITLTALIVDQVVSIVRAVINTDVPIDATVNSKWQGFLHLEMQTFLAAFIAFAFVTAVVFGFKSLLKRV
jgi:hypothetical protein